MNKLTAACMMFLSSVSLAAGFQLDVQSARATGMSAAVTGLIDDPSAIYFNPGGLAGRKGFDASLGITLITPMLTFTHSDGDKTSTPFAVSTPPNLFLAFGITEDLSIGVGLFTPFGASSKWPKGWEGQFKAQSSQLQSFDINPTIAYRIHPRLKLGVGFNAVRGTVQIARGLNFVDSQGSVLLGGSAWGYGWNAGVQVEIVEKVLTFGATYRSSVNMGFRGNAHFSNVPVEFSGLLKDQAITADVTLPAQANFGFGITPMEGLRLGLDAHYTEWSSFTELAIRFADPVLTNPLQKSWIDQVSLHVGGEYDVTSSVRFRLGFVYDPTPSPKATLTPDLPDSTRVKVSAGVGWRHDCGFSVDFGYQFVALVGAQSYAPGFEGRYGGTAQVVGLNLGFRMGGATPSSPPAVPAEPVPAPAT